MEAFVDLHTADINELCAAGLEFGNTCHSFSQAMWEKCFPVDVQREGLESSLLTRFGQSDSVENSQRNPMYLRSPHHGRFTIGVVQRVTWDRAGCYLR